MHGRANKLIFTTKNFQISINNNVQHIHTFPLAGKANCTKGFITQLMPANSHPQANGYIDGWQTILIPKISLTCGMLKTIVSVAELTVVGNVQNGTLNPTIQLWRWRQSEIDKNQLYNLQRYNMIELRIKSEECKMIPENEANQVPGMDSASGAIASSALDESYAQSAADVFRCIVNFSEYLTVYHRDILGIELPPKQNTTFEILFFKNSTLRNRIFSGNYYETRPHFLNLINSTNILQQPQIKLRLKHPGKYVIVLSSVILNDT